MTTLFICRKCIAHALQTPRRLPAPPNAREYAQAAQASGTQSPHLRAFDASFAWKTDDSRSRLTTAREQHPTTPPGELMQTTQHDGRKTQVHEQWEDYASAVEAVAIPQKQLATAYEELKEKVLQRKHFRAPYSDLTRVYGLSPPTARHATSQLARLLDGCSVDERAIRFESYHVWKKCFAQLLASTDDPLSSGTETPDKAESRIWKALDVASSTIRAAWQTLDEGQSQRLWPEMIMSASNSNPRILPRFLRATFSPSWCPSYVVEDVLYFLFHDVSSLKAGSPRSKELLELVFALLPDCPQGYMALSQLTLQRIISMLSNPDIGRFYDMLNLMEQPLPSYTLLHFASRFAKSADTKSLAAGIIRRLAGAPGFDINSPASASVCTSLLTLGENGPLPDGDAAPDELFKLLLEHGMRPNLLELSALMRNFCVRGYLDIAWTIFDLLHQHGYEPDHYVYSILLNRAKKDLDIESVMRIIHMVNSHNKSTPVIVNDYLEFIFRYLESQSIRGRRQRKKVLGAWPPMLQLYAKYYDLGPLQKLTLFPLENLINKDLSPKIPTQLVTMINAAVPRPSHRIMQPDICAIAMMLAAHMRSINTPGYVRHSFNNFRRLLHTGGSTAVELVENHGTRFFDIFLQNLVQFRETLPVGTALVRKMLRTSRHRMSNQASSLRYPAPSTHTLTILLNGFKNHKLPHAAVRVMNLMTQHKLTQPSVVTWNALIKALAETRHVRLAVQAVRFMEQSGFQTDEHTMRIFEKLPLKERKYAIQLLEYTRKQPIDFSRSRVFELPPRPLEMAQTVGVTGRASINSTAEITKPDRQLSKSVQMSATALLDHNIARLERDYAQYDREGASKKKKALTAWRRMSVVNRNLKHKW